MSLQCPVPDSCDGYTVLRMYAIEIGFMSYILGPKGFIFQRMYEAVSEWVTEKVLRGDKNHSTGLTMSDPQIMVPNEP